MLKLIEQDGKQIIFGYGLGSMDCPKRYYDSQLLGVMTDDVIIYLKEDDYFKEITRCPIRLKMYHFKEEFKEKIFYDLEETVKNTLLEEVFTQFPLSITVELITYVNELINQGIISKDVFSIYKKDGVTQ